MRIEFAKYAKITAAAGTRNRFQTGSPLRKIAMRTERIKHDDIIPKPLHSVATKYVFPSTCIAICGELPPPAKITEVLSKMESIFEANSPAHTRKGKSISFIAKERSVNA